jgi:hypothetical protein
MADEITAALTLKVANGNADFSRQIFETNFDQSAVGGNGGIMSVPTTAAGTAIPLGSLSGGNLGWAYFRNTDPTNFVEIGVQVAGTFYAFGKLPPGEFTLIQLNVTNAPYARADTAAVEMEYWIARR